LGQPQRKAYTKRCSGISKSEAVLANPFISSAALAAKLQLDFGFPISRQLANAVVRQQGFTRKKARFFGSAGQRGISRQEIGPSCMLVKQTQEGARCLEFHAFDVCLLKGPQQAPANPRF
jgi:hypothetical protein